MTSGNACRGPDSERGSSSPAHADAKERLGKCYDLSVDCDKNARGIRTPFSAPAIERLDPSVT